MIWFSDRAKTRLKLLVKSGVTETDNTKAGRGISDEKLEEAEKCFTIH
jgi:hypothetical protein